MTFHASMLAGPLIGAVIGYFTNYIAVKMLFRPRHAVKIGSWTLPMTPGVIPKGKARLARAIGTAVSENLLSHEDMSAHLINDETRETVVDRVMDFLNQDMKDDFMKLTGTEEGQYEEKKEKVIANISEYLSDQIGELPIKEKISELVTEAAQEKVTEMSEGMMGQMIAMFMTPDKIKELADPMGWKAEKYINENAYDYIQPMLTAKTDELQNERALDLLNSMDFDDLTIRRKIGEIYTNLVDSHLESVMADLNIAKMIEDKINGMDVVELEELVLSVMKKELGMIVNLGALIGLVIGTINIFI